MELNIYVVLSLICSHHLYLFLFNLCFILGAPAFTWVGIPTCLKSVLLFLYHTVQVKMHAEMSTDDADPDDSGDCEVFETQTHLTWATRQQTPSQHVRQTGSQVWQQISRLLSYECIPDTMTAAKTHTTHTALSGWDTESEIHIKFFRSNLQRGTKHNTIKMKKKKQKPRGLAVKERTKWVREHYYQYFGGDEHNNDDSSK